jgi:hypothetical protein
LSVSLLTCNCNSNKMQHLSKTLVTQPLPTFSCLALSQPLWASCSSFLSLSLGTREHFPPDLHLILPIT